MTETSVAVFTTEMSMPVGKTPENLDCSQETYICMTAPRVEPLNDSFPSDMSKRGTWGIPCIEIYKPTADKEACFETWFRISRVMLLGD